MTRRGGGEPLGPSPPMPENLYVIQMKLVGLGKQEGWEGNGVIPLITPLSVKLGQGGARAPASSVLKQTVSSD